MKTTMKTKIIQLTLSLALLAGLGCSAAIAAEESQAELKAQANITQEEATKTALVKVPNGKIEASELEKEHGKLIWSFDISMPKSKNITEVQVDAKTGKIVSTQIETPSDQSKEAAADKKATK
jgi:PBP1b-binding outer membrane lipoprotein LpoB